jgi:hypothetical protein
VTLADKACLFGSDDKEGPRALAERRSSGIRAVNAVSATYTLTKAKKGSKGMSV